MSSAPQSIASAGPGNATAPDGVRVLSGLSHAIRRYVVLPKAQADALALWVLHTHAVEASDVTPYIHITSVQKGCGKTRLLRVLSQLVAEPVRAASISPAALYRLMDKKHPTLLLDEVDQQMKGSHEMASVIRGVLNCGFERGTPYIRNVEERDSGNNKVWVPTEFDTFGPKALAGIGKLWETVADRSLPIRLQRRLAREAILPFRVNDAAWHLVPLKKACALWAQANLEALRKARPEVPAVNREADLLEPLLAIADVAGGEWPDRARRSLLEVSRGRAEAASNAALDLLADIRDAFGDDTRLSTQALLERMPLGPGMGSVDGRRMARTLRRFGLGPRSLRIEGKVLRGYERSDFEPVWERYLPAPPMDSPAAATFATDRPNSGENGDCPSATEEPCSGSE